MSIEKKSYSIYEDIKLINTAQQKKRLVTILENFKNAICELYLIDRNLIKKTFTNKRLILEFFINDVGVLSSEEDDSILKKLLGKKYINIISVFDEYLDRYNNEYNPSLIKYIDKKRKEMVEQYLEDFQSPTIIDLFCGAGGMSLGFYQNKFKTLLANDIEEVCVETYSFNHLEVPRERVIAGDIKQVVENIETYINDDVDVILGGPPCQGFSNANRQRVIDDPRNVLYKYYVKAVGKIKPKFFVMENVRGMLDVANQVVEDFHSLEDVEYDVAYKVFNAKDFSVPQNRERLIYIGIRNDICTARNINAEMLINEINFELKELEQYVLIDAIENLKDIEALKIKNATELDTEESGKKIMYNEFLNNDYINLINNNQRSPLIFNHKARYNNERDIEIFSRLHEGNDSSDEKIADIMPYTSRAHMFKDKYFKLDRNKVCKTITAHMKFDCNMYIHPYKGRGLTPREAARVQSYPDDYMFLGPYTKTYMQIGNSVPPLMTRIIAKIIKKYLETI
ncbi:MAG: DNA cytosine methyltransferase [Sarcina sp.]